MEENKNGGLLQSLLFSGGSGGGGSGGGGVLVVHQHESDDGLSFLLDKTWKEIHDAPFAVLNTVSGTETTYCPIVSVFIGDFYRVTFSDPLLYASYKFDTDSENGYPERDNK